MIEFLVHAGLLGGDVLATMILGWGIIWEGPEQPSHRHKIARWLVMCSIAAETLFSVSLFLYDESISEAQQSKIINLETRLSDRELSDAQVAEIVVLLKPLPPQVFMTVPYWDNPESVSIANRINTALLSSGWAQRPVGPLGTKPNDAALLSGIVGVVVRVNPLADADTKHAAAELISVLNAHGITTKSDAQTMPQEHQNLIDLSVGSKR